MNAADRPVVPSPARQALVCVLLASLLPVAGCGKDDKGAPTRPPVEVTVLTVAPRDVPVSTVFVAQTQSSQAVNIAARVSGFLDKRVYVEGSVVKAGQVLFRMDQKPFQAQVDAAAAALQRNQAANDVAKSNLARIKPLAQQNALSQKDLDDAQGQYEQSAAAVAQSKAQLESAQLDLSYTTIVSPVDGVSSFAAVADGTYVNPQNSQLTTVSVLTPMWINFSVSENEMERIRGQVQRGQLDASPGSPVHRGNRVGRRFHVSLQGQDYLRRPVLQFADGNVPDSRIGGKPEGRAAPQPVRAHAASWCDTAERDPRSAARRATGRQGPFRLGRE